MKMLTMMIVLLAGGGLLFSGCGDPVKEKSEQMANATVTLELLDTYKTTKGKPVRVFKAVMSGPVMRENLILVVGDEKATLFMSDASTIELAGTTTTHPFLGMSTNSILALSVADRTKFVDIRLDAGGGPGPHPGASRPKPGVPPPASPMDALKAKVGGGVLKIPELDTL